MAKRFVLFQGGDTQFYVNPDHVVVVIGVEGKEESVIELLGCRRFIHVTGSPLDVVHRLSGTYGE